MESHIKETYAAIMAEIHNTEWTVNGQVTICIVELKSGYRVVGTAGHDPAVSDADAKLAEDLSFDAAIGKMIELFAFYRYQRRHEGHYVRLLSSRVQPLTS